MKKSGISNLSISNQILLIAVIPALLIAIILSAYFIHSQFNYISKTLNRHGHFIAEQLAPASEFSIYSGNTTFIAPLIHSMISNDNIIHIQILNKYNNIILDIKQNNKTIKKPDSFLINLFNLDKKLVFEQPVLSKNIEIGDFETQTNYKDNVIGKVIVTLSNRYATNEKLDHIKNSLLIILIALLFIILIVVRVSRSITLPVKNLTRTVRSISAGNLDVRIEENASGEIGVLQSCINHMTTELKNSQSDMENQLNEYTNELQETLEELEIRNAELDITRTKAISSNKAKSEFLANMSHEIRTPLSGIIGFTELLHGTELSEQQSDYTDTIRKSANNLLEIINDILDLSKIESGKTEINYSEFHLIDIIEDIINLLTPTAYEKNIELFYRVDNNLPEIIQADPVRIHQIITNLVGNAIKFTETGYVYLQVSQDEIDNTEYSIKFTVTDTGIGMNESDKKNLFKAFTQADTTITRRFGGTGLGLVISRKLTLLMNGKIGFDSEPDNGSTFWFCIPVKPLKDRAENSRCDIILANKKIGFFTTHHIVIEIYKNMLESWHSQFCELHLSELLNNDTKHQEYDAIIVYIGRADFDNIELLKKLKNCNISHPNILIASTRSYNHLKKLQNNTFDNAISASEKSALIQKGLFDQINHQQYNLDTIRNHYSNIEKTDWSDLRIMVVDDNDISLRLAEIILHKNNVSVVTARSGEQAIDYAKNRQFDIIFMDLHMPGIDGYETAKRIRELDKNTVIIALTANAMPQDSEKINRSGMNDIIIKPVSDHVMHTVINQWIYHKRPEAPAKNGKEPLTNSIFSLESAKEFTGDNEALALELFSMLRAELDAYTTNIKQLFEENRLDELKKVVHKLHGASRCCGTTDLKNISGEIETSINQGVKLNLDSKVKQLLEAINQVREFKEPSITKPAI